MTSIRIYSVKQKGVQEYEIQAKLRPCTSDGTHWPQLATALVAEGAMNPHDFQFTTDSKDVSVIFFVKDPAHLIIEEKINQAQEYLSFVMFNATNLDKTLKALERARKN